MKIAPVARMAKLIRIEEELADIFYWLGRAAQERNAALTNLTSQSLACGQRMDKSHVVRRKLYP
jgi:hypothetical protein